MSDIPSGLMVEEGARPLVDPANGQQMLLLVLVNIGLAILWHTFLPVWGAPDYVIGVLLGALALTVYERADGLRLWWLVALIAYVLWELVVSNTKMTMLVLRPAQPLDPGIVAVPLRAQGNVEILALAIVVSLTPGTMIVDLNYDDSGRAIFYIHSLTMGDPESLRQEIREKFERRLLLVTRGEDAP